MSLSHEKQMVWTQLIHRRHFVFVCLNNNDQYQQLMV